MTTALHDDILGATVTVLDQGPGVPEAELETIFNKFVQSSLTKTGAGGTGLGLAICHEIVTSLDERIWAENHPLGGAKFSTT
jgi:signal transduction histidine kinase